MQDDFDDLEMDFSTDAVEVSDPVTSTVQIKSKTPKSSGSKPSGKNKNLFFRSTIGADRAEKLAVGENTPIRDVKETLGNIFGLDPDDFHLSNAGRTLNEDNSIKDYGIDNNDELLLIPHSTAGADDDFDDFSDDDVDSEPSPPIEVIKSKTPSSSSAVSSKTPGSKAGNKINVFFRSTIGADKNEKLAIGDQTPISDIKQTVGNMFGLDPDDFHLSSAGRTLDESNTPKDYDIANVDEVLLIPVSTAGVGDEFEDFDDFEDIDSEPEPAPASKPAMKSKTPAQVTSNVSSKTPTSGAGNKKNVFFRSTVGPEKSEKLTVGERAPIRDIKETLGNLFGLDPEDFHLSHAGRTLNEENTPADYGIDNGDEVLLIPHSTAGFF